MFKKRELLQFSHDRPAMLLAIIFALTMLALIGLTAWEVRVSDVQTPIRYSGYDLNIYRDKWYTLTSFGLFAVISLVVNGYLAFKIHALRREVSLFMLSLGIFVGIIGLIVASAVFRLVAFSS